MKRTITRPETDAMLTVCPEHRFKRSDILSIPSGYEAVLVRNGAFTVYREGDTPKLSQGIFPGTADLYFVQMQPSRPLPWGMGGVPCGGHSCGLHGTVRFQVISSRKFLNANLGVSMPLTAQKLFEGVLEPFQSALRQALSEEGRRGAPGAVSSRTAEIASSAAALMEEALEQHGISLSELYIEEIFFAEED